MSARKLRLFREKFAKGIRGVYRVNETRRDSRDRLFIAIDRRREWLHGERVNGLGALFNKLL